MAELDDHLARVRSLWPQCELRGATLSTEGAANDVVSAGEWVFRFPKNEAAERDLLREAKVLAVLASHIDLPVPESDVRDCVMRQRRLAGEPLDRHTLLGQAPQVQDRLVEAIAHFLFQLHRVPRWELEHAGIGATPAAVGRADADQLWVEIERELMPHLKLHGQAAVRELFRPVRDGTLNLAYESVLIHADLIPSHLLWDRARGRLTGVIDFGMAGMGDSAIDYAFIILTFGETPLRRMHLHHPGIGEKIDRARFWARAIELQYALSALRTREPRWILGHIGSALDIFPIGTPWS